MAEGERTRFRAAVVPLAILAAAVLVAWALVATRPEPKRQAPAQRGILVNADVVVRAPQRLDVHAQGTVRAARSLELKPQVTGRLDWIHRSLVPGGLIREGELIYRLEQREFRLALRDARSRLAEAKSQLAQERARAKVARREWELFEEEGLAEGTDPTLALRKPQLRAAEVAVEAAQSNLERAQLELERTTFEAPFDVIVDEESAEIGDLVTPQTQIANLLGTERFWVEVAIPADKVPFIAIPDVTAPHGSRAVVRYDVGGRIVERPGRVARLLGTLNPEARMARLLVEVDDPFGLSELEPEARRGIPLLSGAYVDVVINGRESALLVEVPEEAIRDGDQVFVVGEDDRLEIREVEVVWREPDAVYVRSGLEDGERVVLTRVAQPVEGMKLRVAEAEREEPQAELDTGAADGRSPGS